MAEKRLHSKTFNALIGDAVITPPATGSNVKVPEVAVELEVTNPITDFSSETERKYCEHICDDIIGHPSHYCDGRKYEPKDVIRDWNLNFNLGNAVKYISRNGRKEGNSSLQDLKKAKQYLEFEIEYLENN